MPRKKIGADSALNNEAKISAGKPNQSVEAIRERYKIEEERQKVNYAAASEDKIMRTIRDLARNGQSPTLTPTNKETIKSYLTGNIFSNSARLIEASRYLYYRSPIYMQMIDKYATMYDFNCRMVEPPFSFAKGLDGNKSVKDFDATLDFLDVLSLQNNIAGPMLNMWLFDCSFNLFFHDEYGSFFYPIDPSEAFIDSIYEADGGDVFGMALDMSKWRSQDRQSLIEWLGDPLESMWREYQSNNVKYVHVPAEYSFVLKKRVDSINTMIPPLLEYLPALAALNDLSDVQSVSDETSFYKMIYLPLTTLSGAKTSNDWNIDPKLAIDYFKLATERAVPKGISTAVIPGEEVKVLNFSDGVTQDVNRVEKSQNQILGAMSGMGALLNSTKAINNTELIKNALKAESAYVLSGVLGQLDGWTNMQLMLNVSNYCHVSYIPVTIFTKEDYRKALLEANQHGFMYRLAYGTLLGFTERQTMAALRFESEVLGLQNLMVNPLMSSYTASGGGEKGKTGQGAPVKDADELTPSGERSRNS